MPPDSRILMVPCRPSFPAPWFFLQGQRRKGCDAHQEQEEKPRRAGFEHLHLR
jgi:hypothetical protein